MFRDGRRKTQFMSQEATEEILTRGLAGVLGVHGDDGYPYTVPVSHAYEDGKIYFHCAGSGQVNRLKFLKRQMFGRAKPELLRARVLHPTWQPFHQK